MIIIREIPLPPKIGGYTAPDPEDNYNVYINQDWAPEAKEKALRHELSHIERGDCFCEDVSVYALEAKVKNSL